MMKLSALCVGMVLVGSAAGGVYNALYSYDAALDQGGQCDGQSSYADTVIKYESSGDQFATNPGSTATGLFQITYSKLVDYGYVVGGSQPANGAGDWANVVWTGKNGIRSRDQFMNSVGAQTQMLYEMAAGDLEQISEAYTPGQVVGGVPMSTGGAALASHMLGAGGFQKWAASGFSSAGLDPARAAAHSMSPEQYNQHMLGRVASGGCFDPTHVVLPDGMDGSPVQDLPTVFLMPWDPGYRIPAVIPGMMASVAG